MRPRWGVFTWLAVYSELLLILVPAAYLLGRRGFELTRAAAGGGALTLAVIHIMLFPAFYRAQARAFSVPFRPDARPIYVFIGVEGTLQALAAVLLAWNFHMISGPQAGLICSLLVVVVPGVVAFAYYLGIIAGPRSKQTKGNDLHDVNVG